MYPSQCDVAQTQCRNAELVRTPWAAAYSGKEEMLLTINALTTLPGRSSSGKYLTTNSGHAASTQSARPACATTANRDTDVSSGWGRAGVSAAARAGIIAVVDSMASRGKKPP